MRLALSSYNPVKECQSCTIREETEVSAHILAYQVAHQLVNNYPGSLTIDHNSLIIHLDPLEGPISIDLNSGLLRYHSLDIPLQQNFVAGKKLSDIVTEIMEHLQLPEAQPIPNREIYTLLTKLVEIFHARCGLHIKTLDSMDGQTTWELSLCQQGPQGWVSSDGLVKNRFGEVLDLQEWKHLRPEKLAAYVFGFNRFCRHYPSPVKEAVLN